MADPTAQRIWNTALGQLQFYPTCSGDDKLDSAESVHLDPGNFVARALTVVTKQ